MPEHLTGDETPGRERPERPGGAAPPVTGIAEPLRPDAAPPPRGRPRLRALLASLLVVLAGAALGAGGYAFEQAHSVWRPHVTPTNDGWRLTTSHGLRLSGAALSGDHIAWDAGPFTLLTDLSSGRTRLLGAAAFAGQASLPEASSAYVTWLEVPPGSSGVLIPWVFELASGRRWRMTGLQGVTRTPVVAGADAVWLAALGPGLGQVVRAAEIGGTRRSAIAQTDNAGALIADGPLVAWMSVRPAAPPVITVASTTGPLTRQIAPFAEGSTEQLVGFALAGRYLVWARTEWPDQAGQVLAFDVDTGATRVLAQAAGIGTVAAGDDLAAWTQADQKSSTDVMGRRISGGPAFLVARVTDGRVARVYAAGDTVAWLVDGRPLFDTYLQTSRVLHGSYAGVPATARLRAVARPAATTPLAAAAPPAVADLREAGPR